MFKRLFGQRERDDSHDDPRGGLQSKEYRTADPREIVEEGDVAMSAPGGRERDRSEP